jgi:hypothetical protein
MYLRDQQQHGHQHEGEQRQQVHQQAQRQQVQHSFDEDDEGEADGDVDSRWRRPKSDTRLGVPHPSHGPLCRPPLIGASKMAIPSAVSLLRLQNVNHEIKDVNTFWATALGNGHLMPDAVAQCPSDYLEGTGQS